MFVIFVIGIVGWFIENICNWYFRCFLFYFFLKLDFFVFVKGILEDLLDYYKGGFINDVFILIMKRYGSRLFYGFNDLVGSGSSFGF